MDTIIDLGFRPRTWQSEVFRNLLRFSILVVHRRGGKTILAIMRLVDAALRCPREHGRYAYLAPELKQAKDIAWTPLKHYVAKIPNIQINESECWVQFHNGARIRLYGADDPDSIRGRGFDGIVVDEVAQVKRELWGEVLIPCLADHQGWALFIGTPKGINLFSELYYKALQNPEWFAKCYTFHDTDALLPEEVERMKKDMTPQDFRQELLCDFTASSDNSLISIDDARKASNTILRTDQFDFAPKVMGVDVAWQGGDRSVIMQRQGLQSFQPIIRQGLPEKTFAGTVAQIWQEWKPDKCFVDVTGGYGGEVLSRLQDAGYDADGVVFSEKPQNPRFLNLRAEMWFSMANWIKGGGAIWKSESLIAELCAPTYDNDNASNKLKLESKADIKNRLGMSPDCFIAGTLVRTQNGDIPIEHVRTGDFVSTPVGPRKVIKTWESETDRLTTVRFSNGSVLCGKGKHKIFTWDCGWVRLDALSMDNRIESDSLLRRILWRVSSWFTKASNIGFKAQVDISTEAGKVRRKDFFTGSFGSSIAVLFHWVTRFITRTKTGEITTSPTSNALRWASISATTWQRDSRTRNIGSEIPSASLRQSLPLRHGTGVQRGWPGMLNTGGIVGTTADLMRRSSAVSAVSLAKRTSEQERGFALLGASNIKPIGVTKRLLVHALSAARILFTTSIRLRNVAPVSVQTDCVENANVYNLTLESDNVYYANGILVANCADALALSFAFPVYKRVEIGPLARVHKAQSDWDPYDTDRE